MKSLPKQDNWMVRNNIQPWHLAVLAVAGVVGLVALIGAVSGAVAQRNQVVEDKPAEFLKNMDPNSEQYKILSDK